MICSRCGHSNSEGASYCNRCGEALTPGTAPSVMSSPDTADATLWRQFIGPRADQYLERFRSFRDGSTERFVPTWHWPAFGVGWLWYLYRKMYLHAGVFLLGGLLPMALGAGLIGVIIWNVFAAGAANYLYYMHIKLSLAKIQQQAGTDPAVKDRLIHDLGGIQPYVWWLGIGLAAAALIGGIMEAPPPVTAPTP